MSAIDKFDRVASILSFNYLLSNGLLIEGFATVPHRSSVQTTQAGGITEPCTNLCHAFILRTCILHLGLQMQPSEKDLESHCPRSLHIQP